MFEYVAATTTKKKKTPLVLVELYKPFLIIVKKIYRSRFVLSDGRVTNAKWESGME